MKSITINKMWISIRRVCEMNCPFELVAENAMDWTHFAYIHWKSHAKYKLLFKSGRRSIFYYKARALYPLPFFRDYIVLRDEIPEQSGYRQVYYDQKSDQRHYLDTSTVTRGGIVATESTFLFYLSPAWKYFPALFFWIFKLRMRALMDEDNAHLAERVRLGIKTDATCRESASLSPDLLEDYVMTGLPEAARHFEVRDYRDLMGSARA